MHTYNTTSCHATHVSDLGAVGVKRYDGKGSFSAMRVQTPRPLALCLALLACPLPLLDQKYES